MPHKFKNHNHSAINSAKVRKNRYVAAGISRYRLINVAPISSKWLELFSGDWTWNGSDFEPLDLVHNVMVLHALQIPVSTEKNRAST